MENNNIDTGHWISKVNLDLNAQIGIIYRINSLKTGHYYIGKKLFFNKVGKKRVQKWKDYTSSSKELNRLIEEYGKENFSFLIIDTATSKSELSYKELINQIKGDWLHPKCLNGIVNVRINKKHLIKNPIC